MAIILTNNRFFFLLAVLTGFSILPTTYLYAETFASQKQTHAQSTGAPPTPFYYSNVHDIPVCKYVGTPKPRLVTSVSPPRLFANVKGIYILATRGVWGSSETKHIPLFDDHSLATLAACTLQKTLTTPNTEATSATKVPIYLPSPSDHDVSRQRDQAGNLTAWIEVDISNGAQFYDNLFTDRIVVLHVRFFRSDVNDFESLQEQCVSAFPYLDDKENLHRGLTHAMTTCLHKRFSTVALP